MIHVYINDTLLQALTKQFETKYTLLLAKVDEMEETRLKREEETLVHDTASSVNNKVCTCTTVSIRYVHVLQYQ